MAKKKPRQRKSDIEVESGEKFWPRHKRFKHICCDCHKTHRVNMGVDESGWIWMQWFCDDRATSARRRIFKFSKEEAD